MASQKWNILTPFAQRRHADRHHVEPVEQVLAEPCGRDLARQVAVGRGDDTYIDLDAARAPYPLEGLLLQRAHDLALGLKRHVGDFVEKQCATVGTLERADLAWRRAVRLGAEQLDLEPVGTHRRAIDRDEWAGGATRAGMQEATDHFLAGAGRAGDHDTAAGRRHPVDLLAQLVDRRRDADEVDLAAGAQPQFCILAA